MGNLALGSQLRRCPAVEERLTQPRRLLRQLSDVDSGRLRRFIRSGDLAPCFDAAEDAAGGHAEECPICFYFYPGLNRSKCCGKGICTECFLQLMPSNGSKAVQYIDETVRRLNFESEFLGFLNKQCICPFCKIASYAVEYRGARTMSEKKLEQEEEQRANEAKMRTHPKHQIAGEPILP